MRKLRGGQREKGRREGGGREGRREEKGERQNEWELIQTNRA